MRLKPEICLEPNELSRGYPVEMIPLEETKKHDNFQKKIVN